MSTPDALYMLEDGELSTLSVNMNGSGAVPVATSASGAEDVPVIRASALPAVALERAQLEGDAAVGAGSGGASSAGASSARTQESGVRRGSSGSLVGEGVHGREGVQVTEGAVLGDVEGEEEEGDGMAEGVARVARVRGDAMIVGATGVDRAGCLSVGLLDFPDEIVLHIFSYLDLPDLALLARLSPTLAPLTTDPVLHLHRLRIVSPSRVSHGLFARGPHGQPLRPSVGDLVQRGVLKGLGIERAWRMGGYWGSARSKLQYENGRALARRLASNILASQLRRRTGGASTTKSTNSSLAPVSQPHSFDSPATSSLRTLYLLQVVPDVEGSSPQIARALLPTMRKLKWCLQRDRLARVFKESGVSCGSVGAWLATPAGAERGWRVLVRERDEEKLRLAVCPDIRKARGVFEALASAGKG